MLTSRSHNMVFIHVQKTGGRSVNKVLWNHFDDLTRLGRRHATLAEGLGESSEFANCFVFGFVRNPWDRLVSWYSMIAAAHENKVHARHLANNAFWQAVRTDFSSFDDFIRRGVGDPAFRPKRYRRLRMPQADFFNDLEGNWRADFVGRTENLDRDLAEVMARFEIRLDQVPRVNTSAHAHYADYYTDDLRQIVGNVYAADVERFEYKY